MTIDLFPCIAFWIWQSIIYHTINVKKQDSIFAASTAEALNAWVRGALVHVFESPFIQFINNWL
jgi:hypothetical protein